MANKVERAAGWTSTQAYVMSVICLFLGVGIGYLFRGMGSRPVSTQVPKIPGNQSAETLDGPGTAAVMPEQLKQMADKQAGALLQKLQSDPNNPELLSSLGNIYYDTQQYQQAINYYQRSLAIQPSNNSVRTDMGTAYWYLGDADRAIQEFHIVLQTEPTKANALFNLGIVEWRGKMDVNGAITAWQKLLDTNPNYENKEGVQNLIAQAKKHSAIKPGSRTDKPAM